MGIQETKLGSDLLGQAIISQGQNQSTENIARINTRSTERMQSQSLKAQHNVREHDLSRFGTYAEQQQAGNARLRLEHELTAKLTQAQRAAEADRARLTHSRAKEIQMMTHQNNLVRFGDFEAQTRAKEQGIMLTGKQNRLTQAQQNEFVLGQEDVKNQNILGQQKNFGDEARKTGAEAHNQAMTQLGQKQLYDAFNANQTAENTRRQIELQSGLALQKTAIELKIAHQNGVKESEIQEILTRAAEATARTDRIRKDKLTASQTTFDTVIGGITPTINVANTYDNNNLLGIFSSAGKA